MSNHDTAKFEASMATLDNGVEAFYRGSSGAYQVVATELRKLLCDDEASLLPKVAGGEVELLKLHNTHLFEQNAGLADAAFQLPGQIGRSADGNFYVELMFAKTGERMPLRSWLQQRFIHPDFSIGEVIVSVADAAGAHPANDSGVKAKYESHFSERVYPHCIVAIAEYLQQEVGSQSGADRRQARRSFGQQARTAQTSSAQAGVPALFRYMRAEHVDRFFRDGSLRLSSFAAFKKHTDEQRRDEREGSSLLIHTNREAGDQTLAAWGDYGRSAYVLCGSLRQDDVLMNDFECDSYIQINNTARFRELVAKQISGFKFAKEGPCRYQEMKIVDRDLGPLDVELLSLEELYKLAHDQLKDDSIFLKEQRFSHQAEYRLLWFTSCTTEPFIDIKVPEAIPLCARPDTSTGS